MSEVLFGRGGHIEALRDPEGPERWEVAEMDLTSNVARWSSYSEWANWNEEALNANFREWRRIPLQPAEAVKEAETVTMTAEEARQALGSGRCIAVIGSNGAVWTQDDASINGEFPVKQFAPYTPLLPATLSQVEMAAEIERLTKRVNEEQGISTRRFAEAIEKTNQLRETKTQLASALGSQKAAVVALEQERSENKRLVNKVNALARFFESSKSAIREYERNYVTTTETAGKESGR